MRGRKCPATCYSSCYHTAVCRSGNVCFRFAFAAKTKAYGYGVVHSLHKYVVEMPHFFAQATLIQRAYLLQQHYGIF